MRNVFGNCLVCPDEKTARKVAFDKHVQTRCVTLEGDVVDPQGEFSAVHVACCFC